MLRKIYFNGLSEVITLLVGGVLSIILARVLGPTQWGIYAQIIWFISITVTISSFGLTSTAIRYLGSNSRIPQSDTSKSLVIWISLAGVGLAFVGGLCVFRFAPQWLSLIGWKLEPLLVRLAGVGLISLALTQIGLAMLRGLQAFSKLFIAAIFTSILLLIVALVTIRFPSVATLVLGTSISQFMLAFWIFLQVFRSVDLKSNQIVKYLRRLPEKWRTLFKYTMFVYLTLVADQIVWQRSEMFFLAHLDDPRQSAFYGLAYTISLLALGAIPAAINGTLTPMFSELVHNDALSSLSQAYKKTFSLLTLILLPLALGLAIVAPNLIQLIYGKNYAPVVPVLRWLILSTTIGIYVRPSVSILSAINKPQILLISNFIAIPIDLFLAWRLVPQSGAIGAAQANLIAQLIGAGIAIGYASISAKLHYDLHEISKSIMSAIGCGSIAWLIVNRTDMPSVLALIFAVIFGGSGYIVFLFVLREDHVRSALTEIRTRFR